MVKADSYIEINLQAEGGTVYYSIQAIEPDPEINASVFDLANVERTENGVLIPEDQNYWIIPFNGSNAFEVRNYAWSMDCICLGNTGSGTCSVAWTSAGCLYCIINAGCSHCIGLFVNGSRTIELPGGGIIVRANNVVKE